ncbi:MAG: TonB family protein [Nevskiaceae bacterium]|nr:MAG: TonB family protein [Nevskiaceae bacterium]
MNLLAQRLPILRQAFTERRWPASFGVALVIVLLLFWVMQRVIRVPEGEGAGETVIEGVGMVQAKTDTPPAPDELFKPDAAPPPPPAAPPALAQPNMPTVEMPVTATASVTPSAISVPVTLGSGSLGLGSSGAFGGFAGGRGNGSGAGGGGGGAGYGTGQGFKGKPLIPISTARPQMPEWACKKGIKGWVEVVFTVLPNGRVQDVKIVDADPRGVYEAAAIESISNWIYESSGKAREVKQRVPMDPADCEYNWK